MFAKWATIMMTSSNGHIFRVTGHLCREFTGPRWIPHTKASHGALMFSLICARINGWVNKREAGDLRRYHAHYDVIVMDGGECTSETDTRCVFAENPSSLPQNLIINLLMYLKKCKTFMGVTIVILHLACYVIQLCQYNAFRDQILYTDIV